MKKLLIKLLGKFGYTLTSSKAQRNREIEVINRGKSIIKKISPDYDILNGPFTGIKYPSIDITELTLVPKIVGSYEQQLLPVLNEIASKEYATVIDVGCAEGYYAVGLARMFPDAVIHCYDINQHDLDFCKAMANLNGLNNLTFNNFCSPQTLIDFEYKSKSLLFCDCEGYELELFTKEAVSALKTTDVLIEMHDVVNPIISSTLIKRFENFHDIQIFNNANIDYSALKGLEQLSNAEKAFAVYEHRGGLYQNIFMEWAFLTPKIS
jgi:hypothetical protein